MIVEIAGSQHLENHQAHKDMVREQYLDKVGLRVLRFNSKEALKETDEVVVIIYQTIYKRLNL